MKKGGLDIPTIAMLSEKLVLSKRYSMRNSKHAEINRIRNESSLKHVNLDALIMENHSKPATMTKLKSQQTTASENHFFALQSQGIIARTVSECISKSNIVDWSTLNHCLTLCSVLLAEHSSSNFRLPLIWLDGEEHRIHSALYAIQTLHKLTNMFCRIAPLR
jgi:hypothetical protein